ncbi:MAG: M48 family metalloprotease, partial [Acidobacteriota bacterium]|nr:M48 family metalloprotease [Acidobacteriota bacterium]
KRVVVWDTTVGRVPNDEVLFIFAHETGHYVLRHIVKMMAVAAVLMLAGFWACARLAEWMARRFGRRWGLDGLNSRAGFVVLLLAASLGGFVAEPVVNALSRHVEHEADVYGQEAVHGIVADPQKTAVAAFNALGEAWLEDPHPNAVIEIWLYSHPSTQRRAQFAEHYDPWAKGGHGEFFAK